MKGKHFAIKVSLVFLIIFFYSLAIFAQNQDSKKTDDQKLREEILSVYKAQGEKGLREFYQKHQFKIINKFITDFAKTGVKKRKEEWLKVCEILAEEKKDEKTMADTFYLTGIHFRLLPKYEEASAYLGEALSIYQKLNNMLGQGNIHLAKGDIYYILANNSKALEMYDKALHLFVKADEPLGQGNVYYKKGGIFLRTGKRLKALAMYEKALPFFEKAKDLIGQGNVYIGKGSIYTKTGEHSKALEKYEKALLFFQKSADPYGQGNVYYKIGGIHFNTGDNSKALEMYDMATPFFRQVDNLLGQGSVYLMKGKIYLTVHDHPKALKMFKKALPFFQIMKSPIGQANVYQHKGDIFYYSGDNSNAIEMYEKSLLLYKKAGDALGQGNIFLKKGNISLFTGSYSRAIEMYNKSLLFFKKVGTVIGKGNVYFGKGMVYVRTGGMSKALTLYGKALYSSKKAGDPIGQGNAYSAMGNIFYYSRDFSKANEMYNKANLHFEKSGDIVGQGATNLYMGNIYLSIGDYMKARKFYNKALMFYEKAGDPIGQGNVYKCKGEILSIVGNNSKALILYDKALFSFEKTGFISSEFIVLDLKANALVQLGKKEEALHLFEKGIEIMERIREKATFSDMKQSFMEINYRRYEKAMVFMLENNYYNKSFKYAESMNARVFLDQLAEGLIKLEKGLKQRLKEQRDILVSKLSLINKNIHKATCEKDERKLPKLKGNLRKVQNQLEEVLIKIRSENPLFASVRYPQPISIQSLQREVLKEGEILLRYFISPEKLYVFIVSNNKFKVIPLNVEEKEISSITKSFLRSLNESTTSHIQRYGKTLYEKLIKPLELDLTGIDDIIIVPDGRLETIPFESLVIGTKENHPVFFIERYQIKYIQSASVLAQLRKHYKRNRKTNSFIGFGDPVYTPKDLEKKNNEQPPFTPTPPEMKKEAKIEDEIKEVHQERYKRSGGVRNRLIKSGEEVKTIARLFEKKSQKAMVCTQEQATEEKAKSPDMKDYDFIHFACHGWANDDFQCLILSQDIPGSKEDGYFTLNEIMNCEYHAKLIVLSACQTGSGKFERAEGVTGLTRAMMYAGTPAVVASLWDADDDATKELMVAFYRNMLEKGMEKAEALRQAKLELLNSKEYTSPAYWSAFVLYGE